MENEYIYCLGYKVFKNGHIIGLRGNEIKKSKQIKVKIDNDWHNIDWNKFIYYAFRQNSFDLFSNLVVKSIDNTSNINSLYLERKNKHLQRKYNKNSKLTEEQIKNILEEYNNGNIKDQGLDKNNPTRRVSYRSLGAKYKVSHTLIKDIIMNNGYNR